MKNKWPSEVCPSLKLAYSLTLLLINDCKGRPLLQTTELPYVSLPFTVPQHCLVQAQGRSETAEAAAVEKSFYNLLHLKQILEVVTASAFCCSKLSCPESIKADFRAGPAFCHCSYNSLMAQPAPQIYLSLLLLREGTPQ